MADTKNELINEEDQGMLITLEDENGQEVEFEFLDVIEFEGTEYIVLIENDEDADEVVILQINQIDEETEEYVSIEEYPHNDCYHHRIDKENGRSNTGIHIIIAHKQKQ